jgi:hypothetical protein
MDLLNTDVLPIDRSHDPLVLPWPVSGNLGGFRIFCTIAEWREFILDLGLHEAIPEVVSGKFQRAQKLYFLAWIDFDVIKAGELMALTALELALKDRYGNKKLATLLQHMVEKDGLKDEKIPMFRKYGGSIVANLYETHASRKARKGTNVAPPMTLSGIRNSLAHGDPFDDLPWSGLLELVRDLVEYAYRDLIVESARESRPSFGALGPASASK